MLCVDEVNFSSDQEAESKWLSLLSQKEQKEDLIMLNYIFFRKYEKSY